MINLFKTNITINVVYFLLRLLILIQKQNKDETHKFSTVLSKQLGKLAASLSPDNHLATLTTLREIFDNIIQHPNDDKYRQIEITDHTFSNKVWQYPTGKELMKMSGWTQDGDHISLRDDSYLKIISQLLSLLCEHVQAGVLPVNTDVVPLPDEEFHILINAINNADISCVQRLLRVSHISPNNALYSKSGLSVNLLEISTVAQKIEIVKLLLNDYGIDLYSVFMDDDLLQSYFEYIFSCTPQSFIIAVLKYCGIKSEFRTESGVSLLHLAVYTGCFDVICYLVEECNNVIDVNVTDDGLLTPLHIAYLAGQTEIAQYLLQHSADEYAVDKHDNTPYDYTEGHPGAIEFSKLMQNKRRIHQNPYSNEHCYYMKLINLEIDDEEAISLTMEKFSILDDANHKYIALRPNK